MSEEKALVTVEEQGSDVMLPPGLDLSVAGDENLEQGDIGMPPRLRISSQNRPIEGAEPGKIVNTLTGVVYDTVDFVPMVFLTSTRVMWPAQFNADNIPLCVSDDGEYPIRDENRATNPQAGPCATCRYAQFGQSGEPPECKRQRNFLVSVLPDHEPAIVTMASTGIAPAKQLTALAKVTGISKSITMATRLVSNEKGTWWLPAFVVGRKLTNSEIITSAELRNGLKNLVITADMDRENGEDVVNGTATQVVNPGAPPFDEDGIPF